MTQRDQLLYLARLAEQTERFDDMLMYMRNVV